MCEFQYMYSEYCIKKTAQTYKKLENDLCIKYLAKQIKCYINLVPFSSIYNQYFSQNFFILFKMKCSVNITLADAFAHKMCISNKKL